MTLDERMLAAGALPQPKRKWMENVLVWNPLFGRTTTGQKEWTVQEMDKPINLMENSL